MTNTVWTLVQHSGVKSDPKFRFGVEEAAVTRAGDVDKIRKAGGLLFDNYADAASAAFNENYRPGGKGLYPRVRGSFSTLRIGHRDLYIPVKGEPTGGIIDMEGEPR